MATFQQLQGAGGAESPEALRTLGMLVKSGIAQPGAGRDKSLAGLRGHLKPLADLDPGELDQLESALPGGRARLQALCSAGRAYSQSGGRACLAAHADRRPTTPWQA